MRKERASNRSYSSERRSGSTALAIAGIVVVLLVCSCLIVTRDKSGTAAPPASVTIPGLK